MHLFIANKMAGAPGFEPEPTVLETAVLPLTPRPYISRESAQLPSLAAPLCRAQQRVFLVDSTGFEPVFKLPVIGGWDGNRTRIARALQSYPPNIGVGSRTRTYNVVRHTSLATSLVCSLLLVKLTVPVTTSSLHAGGSTKFPHPGHTYCCRQCRPTWVFRASADRTLSSPQSSNSFGAHLS